MHAQLQRAQHPSGNASQAYCAGGKKKSAKPIFVHGRRRSHEEKKKEDGEYGKSDRRWRKTERGYARRAGQKGKEY